MSGRPSWIAGRVVYWLICMAVISALVGCAPKLPPGMSAEDLQTCDDNAWEDEELSASYESLIDTRPYLALPGDVDLWSPLTGSILPFGEPVVIKFDQPIATDGVLFRNYRVIVTSITGGNMEWVGSEWAVVDMSSFNLQVTWMPPGSGKYIIHVFIRNLETLDWLLGNPVNYSAELSNTLGTYLHYGPFSVAHVCVQIDVPKAGDVVPPQPGTVMPVQNITVLVPTATSTSTQRPSATRSPTSTATSTLTPRPPTRVPPTSTTVPPPPAVICSSFITDLDCRAHDDVCQWAPPPIGGDPVCRDQ